MSQHHISTSKYEILVGWDRPLQYFFGTVWDKAKEHEDEEGIVFATLNLPKGGVDSVAELAFLLRPYVELPDAIREALLEDCKFNRGNAEREWNLEGT